tara:strand:- start:200 stop:568 length:369 start_codon:yes stop_codon:yes gene_type:complete
MSVGEIRIMQLILPTQFAALGCFSGWALKSETERILRRAETEQDDIVAFCDAMLLRLDDIIQHLDSFEETEMPEEELNLYAMLLSLAEIAPAVEFYHQPAVIDGFDPKRFLPVEDFILRPKF